MLSFWDENHRALHDTKHWIRAIPVKLLPRNWRFLGQNIILTPIQLFLDTPPSKLATKKGPPQICFTGIAIIVKVRLFTNKPGYGFALDRQPVFSTPTWVTLEGDSTSMEASRASGRVITTVQIHDKHVWEGTGCTHGSMPTLSNWIKPWCQLIFTHSGWCKIEVPLQNTIPFL